MSIHSRWRYRPRQSTTHDLSVGEHPLVNSYRIRDEVLVSSTRPAVKAPMLVSRALGALLSPSGGVNALQYDADSPGDGQRYQEGDRQAAACHEREDSKDNDSSDGEARDNLDYRAGLESIMVLVIGHACLPRVGLLDRLAVWMTVRSRVSNAADLAETDDPAAVSS